MRSETQALHPLRLFVANAGAAFIFFLIRIFGRTVRPGDAPWLDGPIGTDYVGDRPYEECARREGLQVVRRAEKGGLVVDFSVLAHSNLDIDRVPAEIRRFYECTAEYRMDVWARTFFPANIGLWLLVTTISRKVGQLNFPLRVLDTAHGMESEIVHLKDARGRTRYTGWYRFLRETKRVVYTGFYMTEHVPNCASACVKVVFPMPQGNATVILRPELRGERFHLASDGQAFGDPGFYRVHRVGDRLKVWHVRSLKESFVLYLDADRTLRCDHRVRFWGLPVLHLHYRIERKPALG